MARITCIFRDSQSVSKIMVQNATLSTVSEVQQYAIEAKPTEKTMEKLKVPNDQSKSKLPIVFLHYSDNDYLKHTLGQAKHSNPDSTIYLIGNDTNNFYDFVEHHSISGYFQGAKDFSRIYRHFSTNSYEYELFCFQRWIILKEFLASKRIEKCLYLDSDTMLYADVTEERRKFEQYDFTLSYMTCGSVFFLNRLGALADFCQFLTDIYTKKQRYYYDIMLAQYATFRKNGMMGGANDMTAFDLYRYDHFGEIGEVSQVIDSSVYDPGINVPHPGFEMKSGIKKIIWKNVHPYAIQLRTGKEIKLNSIHFQGDTKRLISQYYTGKS